MYLTPSCLDCLCFSSISFPAALWPNWSQSERILSCFYCVWKFSEFMYVVLSSHWSQVYFISSCFDCLRILTVAFVLLCSHIDHKHYSFSVSTFEVFHQMLFLLMKWLFQLLICDHIDHNHNWMTNVLPIQTPFRCCLIVALIAVIINSNQHQIVSPGGVILELLFYPAFSLVKKQEKVKRTNTFVF